MQMSGSKGGQSDPEDVKGLAEDHRALMQAYELMLTRTAFPQYPLFTATTPSSPLGEGWRSRITPVAESVLAMFGMMFGVWLAFPILSLMDELGKLVLAPVRTRLENAGYVFADYIFIAALTLLFLNMLLPLVRIEASLRLPSNTDKSGLPAVFKPITKRLSARLIRHHICTQLRAIVCLYRARIAATPSFLDERQMIVDFAEQAGKLKDSFEPRWEILDTLRFPSIIVGLLACLGFIPGQKLSVFISILIICILVLPYILASRIVHLARRLHLHLDGFPVSDSAPGLPYTLDTLEERIYERFKCAGRPAPVRIDLIFQTLAGVITSIGVATYFAMAIPWTMRSFLFWSCIEGVYLYFCVFKPLELLRHRTLSSGTRPSAAERPGREKDLRPSKVSVRLSWLVAFCCLLLMNLPLLVSAMYPALVEIFTPWKSGIAFVDQHVGMPLQLTVPASSDKSAFTIIPKGSNQPCLLSTGDIVTILKDEKTVEVVSGQKSSCPPHYQAQLTSGIITAAGGFPFVSGAAFSGAGSISSTRQTSH